MENNVKLAVRKEPSVVPGGGFHYMLHPVQMRSDEEAALFAMLGYRIIEVDAEKGERLIAQASAALTHQVQVAILVDAPQATNKNGN